MTTRAAMTRLVKLEASVPPGCMVCRSWSTVVLEDEAGNRNQPEQCPVCGRTVRAETYVFVGIPLEAI